MLGGLHLLTPNLVGNDSYFHIRYARVVWDAGLLGFPPPFVWLPLTILAPDVYADHHMLYHVLLVPFALGDLRIGGKVAAVAGAFAFVVAFVWLLRRERVPPAVVPLAVLALGASSADLLFRLSMTRVQALSLVCLLVGFHLALHGRRVALVVLGCVYAWLYDGFPLLLVPVGSVILADLIVERRLRLDLALAAVAGMAIGLVVNPYFPEYLQFIVFHFADKLVPQERVRVGREWYPYDPLALLGNALLAMLYVVIGVRALRDRGWTTDRRGIAALGVALVFLALMLRSKRFIEYFAPVATVFVALTAGGMVLALPRARRLAVAGVLAAVLVGNVVGVGSQLVRSRNSTPYDRYAAAAQYVAREAPPGAMLCTTDWDDFPWLYFYNVESTYLTGLDPTYLRDRFHRGYWEWVDLSEGRRGEPSRFFSQRFPCAYVMSDLVHHAFLAQAKVDPGLELVLEDRHMVLYRVRRAGPPPVHPTTLGETP